MSEVRQVVTGLQDVLKSIPEALRGSTRSSMSKSGAEGVDLAEGIVLFPVEMRSAGVAREGE
jgi:hypothetical protein